MVRVRVHPIDGSIAQSFIERLLMFDVELCLDDGDVQFIRQQHATLLEASIAKVTATSDADQVFTLFNEMNTIEINGVCSMVLHDVLPSGENHGLINPSLDTIWASIDSNIEGDESHYWVAESDVVDALVRIALHQPELPNHIDIAGRRRWSTQQTHREMQMLYNRTRAGSTGQFTATLLDQPSSPTIAVVPINAAHQSTRPSLGQIHDVLEQCDGQGWQPTSPLRTAMMVYLAGKLND
tara:strand:+ start:1909 stop:2625 length:717 start_codon:yes stop_codon:yes gene_type:complete